RLSTSSVDLSVQDTNNSTLGEFATRLRAPSQCPPFAAPAPKPRRSGARVIRYVFGPEDLGRVRFAISPVFELAASIDVLRNPDAHSLHEPWIRWAAPRAERV